MIVKKLLLKTADDSVFLIQVQKSEIGLSISIEI